MGICVGREKCWILAQQLLMCAVLFKWIFLPSRDLHMHSDVLARASVSPIFNWRVDRLHLVTSRMKTYC